MVAESMSVGKNQHVSCELVGEAAMVAFGQRLGRAMVGNAIVFLEGQLGAGKTTLSRGILQAFGHQGAVKSPTYTLVEPYQFAGQRVNHFDLYRLADPEELEYIGIRDYLPQSGNNDGNLCLIEWPNRGAGYLPLPDLTIDVAVAGAGRKVTCMAATSRGCEVIKKLQEALGE